MLSPAFALRVLRRLTLDDVATSEAVGENTSVGVVVDVDTTGVKPEQHKIIELALRRFRFDTAGVIVKVDRPHAWLQDPGAPLDKEIAALTSLTDADLAGQAIDEAAATKLLKSAAVVIAHHAAFDRKFVERRLPEASGLAWACSCHEIDWQAGGFDGKGLGWLLSRIGAEDSRMVRKPGLLDLDERCRKLSEVGDPLVRLRQLVDFEVFRAALTKALRRPDGSKGGRPPYDAVLMFKVPVGQTLYTLSDDVTEFHLRDRFSFMRFLGHLPISSEWCGR